MPQFSYIAMSGDGTEHKGVLDGPDAQWVNERLVRDQLLPVEVKAAGETRGIIELIRSALPVTTSDLSLFSSQFAMVVEAGLPMLASLELMSKTATKRRLGVALEQAAEIVRQGGTVSDGLASSGIYSQTYLSMVTAGEEGGRLPEVLSRLALYLDREASLRNRVVQALAYPAFLAVLSVLVCIFLMIFIVPRFTTILQDLGVDLPWPTRVLIGTQNFVADYWLWLATAFTLPAVAFLILGKEKSPRHLLESVVMRVPLLGELMLKSHVARFSYVLSSLLTSGISIVGALETADQTIGNRGLREAARKAKTAIEDGHTISEALTAGQIFPDLMIHMVSLGEVTGKIDQVLEKLAEIYDDQVERGLSGLVGMIEPAMILFMGLVVGFVAMTLVLPMVRSISAIGS